MMKTKESRFIYAVYTFCQHEGIQELMGYTETKTKAIAFIRSIKKAVKLHKKSIEALSSKVLEATESEFNRKYPELIEDSAFIEGGGALKYREIRDSVIKNLPIDEQLALEYHRSKFEFKELKSLNPT